ncbi:hypothetical protein GGR52DRAFT_589977 [Hypoxylon sp. FL1284]|nr:hypothetical protein GGR52DRAFT_589977 [Hypoxylon sp. FL1284]
MAVVLSSEDNDLFSSSALRRSHSQSKFISNPTQHDFHTSASASRIHDAFHESFHDAYHHKSTRLVPNSSPSSAPSSPRTIHVESADPSYSSTPATNLSLDGQCEDEIRIHPEDHILLPEFDRDSYFGPLEDLEPPPSPRTGDSYTVSPTDQDTSATTSRPESPGTFERAEDDTAVERHPTQHVDYLSHDWREEDIWSSWRYIVSKRGEYINGPRLENASWRTWMKAKYKLKTVSPETLNWLKDCDVTWLYGPLQTRQGKLFTGDAQGSSTLSRTDSFINKKPILKKRSMSEIMLQRSLSSSSLLKQATAAVQAQQKELGGRVGRPALHRATTDSITFPFSSKKRSGENTSLAPSTSSSGVISPYSERKHIHFDEQVLQCIAVDAKCDEEEEDEVDHCRWRYGDDGDDSDSDDGAIMMKKTKTTKKPVIPRRRSPVNTPTESKTIAMLPSTTLKYREDSPNPETAMKHSTGNLRSPILSPSPSQETLRPSKSSGAFFVGDEEDEDDDETSLTPQSSPVDAISHFKQTGSQRLAQTSGSAEPAGMRRTESGMLMPFEDGNVQPNDGIIGRVIDTVNTARDIAHVIWNVGWRR